MYLNNVHYEGYNIMTSSSSSLLSVLPKEASAVVCSFMLVAQVFIAIYVSSFFLLLPQANQSAFGTLAGPNEQIVFFSEREGNQEVYVMNASDGSNQTRLTSANASDSDPSWSPDHTKIAFESDRDGNSNIYVMNADGSGLTQLTYEPTNDSNPSWSPDGTKIAFGSNRDGNQEIYVMNAADGSNQTRLTYNEVTDAGPSWSPDGTKIAFASAKDGNFEIYLMNAADGSVQTRLTN